jgi:hypothetical protein
VDPAATQTGRDDAPRGWPSLTDSARRRGRTAAAIAVLAGAGAGLPRGSAVPRLRTPGVRRCLRSYTDRA